MLAHHLMMAQLLMLRRLMRTTKPGGLPAELVVGQSTRMVALIWMMTRDVAVRVAKNAKAVDVEVQTEVARSVTLFSWMPRPAAAGGRS